eukprot:CAMPEP_0167816148 /NCGR_PEP_ID=MMETSP0112_2-20121227/3427_1 /TAXON_ID=91324 /ORGANISM="Lotharella globosa, Strain CCCM811" /LENGTH=637 /DNA_ID=CAMNT_0007715667 /DNA_START=17 /DNA_END=1930 /DNA_ORIENTATION=-
MEAAQEDTQAKRLERRRLKVEARKEKNHSKLKGPGNSSTSNGVSELRRSKKQIKFSRDVVDAAAEDALETVTNVAVDANDREMRRRRFEGDLIIETRQKMEDAMNEGDIVNREIEEGWEELHDIKTSEELYEGIEKKKEKCAELDQAKQILIQELQKMLLQRDEQFTKQLRQNVEDVGVTLTVMKAQFHTLSLTYERELGKIEESFVKERAELLASNAEELDKLFQIRSRMENTVLKEAEKKEDECYAELRERRLQSKEDYNNLKITLENNIQMLQQQLEEMRSTYQLNTQKLEYNLNVLKERDTENRQTVDQFTRKIQRLQEQLSKYREKYNKEDKYFKGENNELTEDYRKITEKFKDLQKKFRHFEIMDNQKYDEVFDMNKKNVMDLVGKVLKADEIIHDQILGKRWHQPSTYTKAVEIEASRQEAQKTNNEPEKKDKSAPMYTNEHIRIVMTLLANECQFLIDSHTLEACKSVSIAEAQLLKADAILSSLGLDDRGDLDRLCGMFFRSPKDLDVKFKRHRVISEVNSFVINSRHGNKGRSRTKREKRSKRDLEFWDNLEKILPGHTETTWAALEAGLTKYNQLLTSRQKDIDETNSLLKTNEELKMLLQQYLNNNVNQDLQLPPTHHITTEMTQ